MRDKTHTYTRERERRKTRNIEAKHKPGLSFMTSAWRSSGRAIAVAEGEEEEESWRQTEPARHVARQICTRTLSLSLSLSPSPSPSPSPRRAKGKIDAACSIISEPLRYRVTSDMRQ